MVRIVIPLHRFNRRRFFHYNVCIRASHPKGTYTSPPGSAVNQPRGEFGVHIEWTVFEVNGGIWSLEIDARRYLLVLERQYGLDQACNARSGLQMTHVALD